MKVFADYHTHTIYSHGKGTIRENVEAAIKCGLREIAISDHGPGHMGFGVNKKNLYKMKNEIEILKKEYNDIKIIMGLEANIISYDGDIDVDDEILDIIDILLVGFHFGARPISIKDAYNMFGLNYIGKFNNKVHERVRYLNTKALINAINRYDIFLITHPGDKVSIDTRELAKVASRENTALEINSSHGFLSTEYIKIALEEKAKFIISSDAHKPDDIGNFANALERVREVGLSTDMILNAE